MTIEIVNSLPLDEWQLYLDNHPQANIFHTPEMFQVFAKQKNNKPQLWAAVDAESILALLLPVNITLKDGLGLLRQLTTRAVVYGSLLYTPTDKGREALQQLLTTYNAQIGSEVIFTELRNAYDSQIIQSVLQQQGYVYEEHLNYLININLPPDQILQNMGKRTRKQIRSGLNKEKVVMSLAQTKEEVHEVYQLIKKSYDTAQVYLADLQFFEVMFELLHPLGMVQFWLAHLDGVCIASSVELPYKDVLYGFYSGVDRTYAKYYPGEMLMWHVLQWGAENGYKIYDFGGAGRPDEKYGVRDFKAKFGGDLVNYGRNICVHRPVTLQVSKLGYEVYRRLR